MSKGKLLAVVTVWLLLVAVGAVGWRWMIRPAQQEAAEQAHDELIENTSGQSKYRHSLQLALDQFSGYAILRSPEFHEELARKAIRLQVVDDGADYAARIQQLQDGRLQMAVFTIDALVKASARLQDVPGVIVAILDETRGADAMIADKQRFPNVAALNDPATRFVLTPDSPSETLARVVMSQFNLDRLAEKPFIATQTPAETFQRYQASKPQSPEVFVVWEPYVSRILENEALHVVVDSSRFRGYIVDVLVVSRDYLRKNESVVRDVVGAYFTAAYQHRSDMEQLVLHDSQQTHQDLTAEQAKKMTAGIAWKNTQENFAHFGLLSDRSRQHVEDMISNITGVLQRTGAIARDPTNGQPAILFNQRILAQLQASEFHPGLHSETLAQEGTELPKLTEDEWSRIRPIGELKVPPLVFARGTAELSPASRVVLDELVGTLNTWPQYYVLVQGDAALRGDLEANRRLALARANAAAEYLVQRGIHASRVRAQGVDPTGETSVSFVLGESPY